jgi:replicative DNA helicase
MKTKISKAQEEVWEWQEKAFLKLSEISENERVKHIASITQETINRIKKKKAEIAPV